MKVQIDAVVTFELDMEEEFTTLEQVYQYFKGHLEELEDHPPVKVRWIFGGREIDQKKSQPDFICEPVIPEMGPFNWRMIDDGSGKTV